MFSSRYFYQKRWNLIANDSFEWRRWFQSLGAYVLMRLRGVVDENRWFLLSHFMCSLGGVNFVKILGLKLQIIRSSGETQIQQTDRLAEPSPSQGQLGTRAVLGGSVQFLPNFILPAKRKNEQKNANKQKTTIYHTCFTNYCVTTPMPYPCYGIRSSAWKKTPLNQDSIVLLKYTNNRTYRVNDWLHPSLRQTSIHTYVQATSANVPSKKKEGKVEPRLAGMRCGSAPNVLHDTCQCRN